MSFDVRCPSCGDVLETADRRFPDRGAVPEHWLEPRLERICAGSGAVAGVIGSAIWL